MHEAPTKTDLVRLAYHNACIRLELDLLVLANKAGFRPDQPRVPTGNPDGGQWTEEGGDEQVQLVSRRGPRGGSRVVNGRWRNATPDQEARLSVSFGRLQEALKAVRKVDPRWRPTPQAYETIEGHIRANEAQALEAHFRVFELRKTPIGPGPYAVEWIPAPATNRRLNPAEQREINRIGSKFGCHRCGKTSPGTRSRNFIGDHQWPKKLGRPLRIYPHCVWCMYSQGGLTSQGKY